MIYKFLQDWISTLTPQYWQFWIGLVLVVIVLVGRERIGAGNEAVRNTIYRLGARLFARLLARPAALRGAAPDGS